MKQYVTFLNFQGPGEMPLDMQQLVDTGLLMMMYKLTKNVPEIPVIASLPKNGKAREQVREDLQTPMTPLLKNSGKKKNVEEKKLETSDGVKLDFNQSEILEEKTSVRFASSERDNVELVSQPFLQWSNAHIEAMILHLLGPSDCDEAASIFEAIIMSEDEVMNKKTAMAAAWEYTRKWEEMLSWCSRYLPHPKALVKTFLANLQPRPLASILEKRYLKDVNECINVFLSLFSEGLKSKKSGSMFEKKLGVNFENNSRKKVAQESTLVSTPGVAAASTQGPLPHGGASTTCHPCG